MRKSVRRISRIAVLISMVSLAILAPGGAAADGIRMESLAGARLAVGDRDNHVNPFDFGRNPAWLHNDFEYPFIRFVGSLYEISGGLKRDYDPRLINDAYIGVEGVKALSDRQTVRGYINYQRLRDREVFRNLEIDQYNDPFYLDDQTTGDFEYYGPRASVDWGIRLLEDLYFGAGFEYDISTGLKQIYTRPEIVHNYFNPTFGLTWQPSGRWVLGVIYRYTRLQNRTEFAKPDEGYDNVIQGYAGDAIYEVRAFSSYQITDLKTGHVGGLQGFYLGDEIKAGLNISGGISENDVKYNASRQYPKGYWREDLIDADLRARYEPSGIPLAIGVSGRFMKNDGWGVRPDFSEVLLYDNPYAMYSAGIGAAYRFTVIDLMLAGEYVAEKYDIEVWDNGANLYRMADHVSNIGRFAVEKNISNVYSFRAGYEYVDFPIDRWLKLPANIDISRITGGFGMFINGWNIDFHAEYGIGKKKESDEQRQSLGAVVWFTKYLN